MEEFRKYSIGDLFKDLLLVLEYLQNSQDSYDKKEEKREFFQELDRMIPKIAE